MASPSIATTISGSSPIRATKSLSSIRNGKAIAKRRDFNGLSHDGSIKGLLFPASPSFSPNGKVLYVTNLALYLPIAGVSEIAVDSAWTLQVKHYNVAKIELEDSD